MVGNVIIQAGVLESLQVNRRKTHFGDDPIVENPNLSSAQTRIMGQRR